MSSVFHKGTNHIFTTFEDTKIINLKAGLNETLNMSGDFSVSSLHFITGPSCFPEPVSGVITLETNHSYFILNHVDLLGLRIVCAVDNVIEGVSSENCSLTSTGLGVGVALVTSQFTLILKNITFIDVDTCLDLDATIPVDDQVIDWFAVNFENIPNIGSVDNYSNFIFSYGAFLSSANLEFFNIAGTVGFNDTLFVGISAGGPLLMFDDNEVITRRIKIKDSAFVVLDTGIDVSVLATVPNQGYIIDSCNFSGPGTFLVGVQSTSNKDFFSKNFGIANSRSAGGFHITVPILTVLTLNTWTKVLGTTALSLETQKFTDSGLSNHLLFTGTIEDIFFCTYTTALSGSNGKDIQVGVSINGADPEIDTLSISTTDSACKVVSNSTSFFHDLKENDTIELWVMNLSDSTDVTFSQISISVFGSF